MKMKPHRNKRTGLPAYVVRKKSSSGVYYYLQRREFRIPLPAPDAPDFIREYEAGMVRLQDNSALAEEWGVGAFKMPKNEVDQYFAPLEMYARSRAKRYDREYSLPKYWGADQYILQGGRCALSGIVMRPSEQKKDPFSPTIDRIDSSAGYTPENCHLVALRVNLAKSNMSCDDFVAMCVSVSKSARERLRNGT